MLIQKVILNSTLWSWIKLIYISLKVKIYFSKLNSIYFPWWLDLYLFAFKWICPWRGIFLHNIFFGDFVTELLSCTQKSCFLICFQFIFFIFFSSYWLVKAWNSFNSIFLHNNYLRPHFNRVFVYMVFLAFKVLN